MGEEGRDEEKETEVKPDYRPKLTLDYSSPVEEGKREKAAEDKRRDALGDYSESTFGERHPFRNSVLWLLVSVVIAVPLALILPRWAVRLLPLLIVAAVLVWSWVRRR